MGIRRFWKNWKVIDKMVEEKELDAGAPAIMTEKKEDEQYEKYLNEIRKDSLDEIKQKFKAVWGELDTVETMIRQFDVKILSKQVLTPDQEKRFEKLKKEQRKLMRRRQALQSQIRNT